MKFELSTKRARAAVSKIVIILEKVEKYMFSRECSC